MGVNYTQHCIIGVRLSLQDLKVITSPAVYELQNRYDIKTGKINNTENVLVKKEESHYEFESEIYHEYWEIIDIFFDKQSGLGGCFSDINESIYLGFIIKTNFADSRVDLIEEELNLDTIKEKFDLMQERFPNYPIKMYFVPYAG